MQPPSRSPGQGDISQGMNFSWRAGKGFLWNSMDKNRKHMKNRALSVMLEFLDVNPMNIMNCKVDQVCGLQAYSWIRCPRCSKSKNYETVGYPLFCPRTKADKTRLFLHVPSWEHIYVRKLGIQRTCVVILNEIVMMTKWISHFEWSTRPRNWKKIGFCCDSFWPLSGTPQHVHHRHRWCEIASGAPAPIQHEVQSRRVSGGQYGYIWINMYATGHPMWWRWW